jgi:hypothetical protein
VPDFAKAPVSLSGVVLGTRPSEPGSAFHDVFPLAPTARRQFATTDHVTAFVRVYQAENDSAVPIAITTRIVDALNRTAYEARTALFDADRVPTRSADFRFDLPLASLSTGQYVLSIEATRKTKQTARHDVVFSVR